jgi:hypothetical protein
LVGSQADHFPSRSSPLTSEKVASSTITAETNRLNRRVSGRVTYFAAPLARRSGWSTSTLPGLEFLLQPFQFGQLLGGGLALASLPAQRDDAQGPLLGLLTGALGLVPLLRPRAGRAPGPTASLSRCQ